jgi:para-nitrobenzyl esterase
MKKIHFVLIVAVLSGLSFGFVRCDNLALIRFTNSGVVLGQVDEAKTWVWKAIPFAKPPTGNLRWMAPQDPDAWFGIRYKTEFSDICTQYVTDPNDIRMVTGVGGSEDCLYLNIWRPRTLKKNLPVYFWIHGGGNTIQSPKNSDLSGANLASYANMVVVSINYRLGSLGWLTHPALRTGTPYDNSGNYGNLDMIKALQWVRDNIANFGGDPHNITIAGQSAGGGNVLSLLLSPLAKDLFHKAVVESGGKLMTDVSKGEEFAESLIVSLLIKDGTAADETAAKTYRETMSDDDIHEYLMSKSSQELVAVVAPGPAGMSSIPTTFKDGVVLPATGFSTMDDGSYPNKVPIIIGSNKEEVKLFLFGVPPFKAITDQIPSISALRDHPEQFTALITPELIEIYQLSAQYGSQFWTGTLDSVARSIRNYQEAVYAYYFQWGYGGDNSVVPYPFNYILGACHGIEIDFFFGVADSIGGTGLYSSMYTEQNLPGRIALSNVIMSYLANFARTGDPNGSVNNANLPVWQNWSNENNQPKKILFDADYNNAQLEMSTVEYTNAGVISAILSETRASELIAILSNFSSLL